MRVPLNAFALLCAAGFANADTVDEADITVELNTVQPVEGGCQLTFVASTAHPEGIANLVFETVLFTTEGTVERLTLFDFGALPAGTPRVRQFVLPELECTDLGQLLFNGVNTCDAAGLDGAACATNLTLRSRTEVELLG